MFFLQESLPAVNKKRVVGTRRCLRHSQTGGVCNFVVRSNHERFECIAWIETEGAAARRFCFTYGISLFWDADCFAHLNRRFGRNEFYFARLTERGQRDSL